ncbi:MAG: HAD family hydrolase [Lachnospiraceae bacterium]|nr:HAD family hydrolase [Lachnospiraceae bacterium]
MNKKAVFLDIDGTIVDFNGNIPNSAKTAIRLAKANGHKMVICSGRSLFQMYDELLSLGFSGIVGAAGAFVMADDKDIYHAYIDEEHRKSSFEYLEKNGFFFCYQSNDGIVINERSKNGMVDILSSNGLSELRIERLIGNMQVTDEPWKNEKNEKIVYYNGPYPVKKVAADLAPYFEVVPMSLGKMDDYSGEISIGGINKATGMEIYLHHTGIKREDSIALGDGANDLEMMEYAGIGVAMGNARAEVKELADMITDSIHEDGLYNAFVKLGLI